MKTILSFFAIIISFTVSAQIVNIPDVNFKAYLVGNSQINTNDDNEIQISEAESFAGEIICDNKEISDLTGIEHFVKIKTLDCTNNFIQNLDVSKNILLQNLNCSLCGISSINVAKNTNLLLLDISGNQIENLDVSNNVLLIDLNFYGNNIASIDLSKNINLTTLDLSANPITSLDILKNITLENLIFRYNNITNLNLTKNVNLKLLDASSGSGSLNALDLSKNTKLEKLYLVGNELASLNLDNNLELNYLDCAGNYLTILKLSNNTKLETLECPGNPLLELDLSANINLKNLNCNGTPLSSLKINNGHNSKILSFLATDNPNLTCIQVDNVAYSTANWPDKDPTATYSTDCSNYLAVDDTKKSTIKIYPNPVKDKFIINTNDKIENVEIYSQTGQLLKTVKSKEVNISNLPKGNYIVNIKTDKETITQKIIKE